jgi:hypothetical protein
MLAVKGMRALGSLRSTSSLVLMAYDNCLWTFGLFVARHIDV